MAVPRTKAALPGFDQYLGIAGSACDPLALDRIRFAVPSCWHGIAALRERLWYPDVASTCDSQVVDKDVRTNAYERLGG